MGERRAGRRHREDRAGRLFLDAGRWPSAASRRKWAKSADPDFDVGFVVLAPHDGRNIEQVLGASQLATDSGYRYLVRVTGG